jgi:4-hydroxyphenylacetate 3-monooxygenase
MSARTGEEFLKGLRGKREIWLGSEKVTDVVDHPAFAGAARGLAGLFDLQHEYADDCLMPEPYDSALEGGSASASQGT